LVQFREMLASPLDKKIYFEPGTNYQYSGVGYIYLQKIIEKVTHIIDITCRYDVVTNKKVL